MYPTKLSFVDIETTGTNITHGRIIEIGILRIENNRLIKKYHSLINPQIRIDPFIEKLTGITQHVLDSAPLFEDIHEEIMELLADSVFVAHSVRFDYGFIRNEFKRLGKKFFLRQLCTVKLARLLYPGIKKYTLDSIIENFGIECRNRHRAIDDANVIYYFYRKSQKEIKKEIFSKAINTAMKRSSIPLGISEKELDSLPENCGVYVFYGQEDAPIYIGKSLNIRDRVLSHFASDHLSVKEMKIAKELKRIDVKETVGELSARLLESALVKKYLPIYNRQLRNVHKMIALKKIINKDGYNSVEIIGLDTVDINNIKDIIGVFRSKKQIKNCFFSLAQKYNLCYKLLGLEKTDKYCFAYHLNRCFGACKGLEKKIKYNLRFDEAFYNLKIRSWPFTGPIVIKEKGDKEESHLIDKWCYLGKINSRLTKLNSNRKYIFDYDVYKIINKYLGKKDNLKNITTIRDFPN